MYNCPPKHRGLISVHEVGEEKEDKNRRQPMCSLGLNESSQVGKSSKPSTLAVAWFDGAHLAFLWLYYGS
jgi:hypothetical protein